MFYGCLAQTAKAPCFRYNLLHLRVFYAVFGGHFDA